MPSGHAAADWLVADLAASPRECVLAVWHHPRFSSGHHGNDTRVAACVRALYRAGAEIVVNGHDHDYERFAPAAPDGTIDPKGGIRQFVVGTGGAATRPFSDAPVAHSRKRITGVHGVLELTLSDSSYGWRFLSAADGSALDSGQGDCH